MYAIIKTGGKQYRVSEGQTLNIERIPSDIGQQVNFEEVLMVVDGENYHVGAPFVNKAKVTAEVVRLTRGPKVDIIKLKRRKHHIKHQGHRQDYTEIKISGILLGDTKVAAKPVAAKADKKVKKPAKVAAKQAAKKVASKTVKKVTKKATKK